MNTEFPSVLVTLLLRKNVPRSAFFSFVWSRHCCHMVKTSSRENEARWGDLEGSGRSSSDGEDGEGVSSAFDILGVSTLTS